MTNLLKAPPKTSHSANNELFDIQARMEMIINENVSLKMMLQRFKELYICSLDSSDLPKKIIFENKKLQQQNEEFQTISHKKTQKWRKLKIDVQNLKLELSNSKMIIKEYQEQIERQIDIDDVLLYVEEIESKKSELESELEKQNDINNNLLTEIKTLKDEIQIKEHEITTLQQNNNVDLNTVQQENLELKDIVFELETKVKEISNEKSHTEDSCQDIQSNLTFIDECNHSNSNDQLISKLDILSNCLYKLEKERRYSVFQSNNIYLQLQNENEFLKLELEKYKQIHSDQ